MIVSKAGRMTPDYAANPATTARRCTGGTSDEISTEARNVQDVLGIVA
jgi:hypothetical protein